MTEQNVSSSKRLFVIAPDWAKAFASIAPGRLTAVLVRFGLPAHFIEMISCIYTGRRFYVKTDGYESGWNLQHYGIVQGCPLSLFCSQL